MYKFKDKNVELNFEAKPEHWFKKVLRLAT